MTTETGTTNAVTADALITFLSDPHSYPDTTGKVEVRDTHMSRVFLTDRYAYKLKKAVRRDFLDYSTPEARHEHCRAEIRLNRRLAASIYLGVVPICLNQDGRLQLYGSGKPIDWLVHMKRLPQEQLLDNALSDDELTPAKLDPVMRLLARFYRESEPVDMAADRYLARLCEQLRADTDILREQVDNRQRSRIDRTTATLEQYLANEHKLLSERARRVVEGHGDLRPEHVYVGTPPAVIDCIEFSREFRINDPLDELAFLDMECRRLHNDWIGTAFIDTYCSIADDFAPHSLLAFYRSRRALLRAKLTLWHLDDHPPDPERWRHKAGEYLELAWSDCEQLV